PNRLWTPRLWMRLCDLATPPGVGAREEQDVLGSRRVTPWTPPERCSFSPDAPTEIGDIWSLGGGLSSPSPTPTPGGPRESWPDLPPPSARRLGSWARVSESFAASWRTRSIRI